MAVSIVRSAEKDVPAFVPASALPTFAFYLVPGQFTKDFIVVNVTGSVLPLYISLIVPDGAGGYKNRIVEFATPINPSLTNGTIVLQRIIPYRVDGEYIGIGSTASGLSVIVTSAILS